MTKQLILCLLVFTLCGGCKKLPWINHDSKESDAIAAMKKGNYSKAVPLFEQALANPDRSGAIHFQLAQIYEEQLNDPVSALHHYRRSIKMSGPDINKAREAVRRMEARIAARYSAPQTIRKSTSPAQPATATHLPAKPALLDSPPPTSLATPPPTDKQGFSKHPTTKKAEQEIGRETRTHTVVKGDTLLGLSRQYYKTTDRWKDIADANQNRLNGSTELKIGMVLIIP